MVLFILFVDEQRSNSLAPAVETSSVDVSG
jgi:hypothetical protein